MLAEEMNLYPMIRIVYSITTKRNFLYVDSCADLELYVCAVIYIYTYTHIHVPIYIYILRVYNLIYFSQTFCEDIFIGTEKSA